MKRNGTGLLSKIAACVLAAALLWLGIMNQEAVEQGKAAGSSISLQNYPAGQEEEDTQTESLWEKLLSAVSRLILGADLRNPESLLQFHFFGTPQEEDNDILFEYDDSELPPEIVLELEKIQREVEAEPTPTPQTSPDPQQTQQPDAQKPSVLIYHTHNDEAYLQTDVAAYKESSTGRTMNQNYSVVKVGGVLADELRDAGFTVYQDKTDHISGGFLEAYSASLKTMEKYTDKCSVFIDLHRDAYIDGETNSVTVKGQQAARIMFVVGTGEGSTGKGYNPKPNWKENYKLALSITNKLNEIYPGICRPVYVRVERFNQHVSDSCMLAEIGNEKNTLEEAELSARVLAEAIAAVMG